MSEQRPHISVISPVYGCKECLSSLCERLDRVLSTISPNYEIILINDASPDEAWTEIVHLSKQNPRIKGVNFSRNFGQHYALSAGFDYASGDWIVVMDCDLQDPPEEITKLYAKTKEGYDIVYGISNFRGNMSWIHQILRKIYFKIHNNIVRNHFKTENLSFYILSSSVRKSMIQFREQSRQISALVRYLGFKIVGIDVAHEHRQIGQSTYNFMKRFKLAMVGLVDYSTFFLDIALYIGFVMSFLSFCLGMTILGFKLANIPFLPGWASLITLMSFTTGIILFVLGIFGIYINKIYTEVKKRPLYLVKEEINFNRE